MNNYIEIANGLKLYQPCEFHPFPFLFCRDDDKALEAIRELLTAGMTIDAHNDYDTFYGCGWGRWLMDGTKDIATAEVLDSWNPGGYCDRPFPNIIRLSPKE